MEGDLRLNLQAQELTLESEHIVAVLPVQALTVFRAVQRVVQMGTFTEENSWAML